MLTVITTKKIIQFTLTLILLFSCEKRVSEERIEIDNSKSEFFDAIDLGAFGSETKLIIFANFDECGEWGGHNENFEIYSKEDKKFYAKYTRTKVDCSKIAELHGKPEFLQPDVLKEFVLSEINIKAINNYLSNLLKSKIKERFPGHSGQQFGVIKSDSTLVIDVYDINDDNLNNYNELLKSFNIEKVEYR